ncbi:MAG: tRNA lysidine(34) synthetase TilS [Cyclobacteriaceae bacterium]|nr:tRNA lysidine(34) synthetase TilS [Cyclobacteriaceae bacterium]
MLEQFLNHIKKHRLFLPGQRILLAVSSGLDSMVMTHLFREVGYSIGVAHGNFQLRGREADEDEHFVKHYCEQHKLLFFSKRFETKAYADQNGLSIQMAARELRYEWFDELLDSENYDHLATAHHLNDSIETILLNWINGSALDGFAGIPVKNRRIVRPMLFATRSDIEQYAREQGIAWREDSSNSTTDYQRNFIRHNITPLLRELNPSFENTLQRGLEKLAGEREFMEQSFERWKANYVVHFSDKIIIQKAAFDGLAHGGIMLYRLINHLGFNFDVCVSVINGLYHQSGKKFIGVVHEMVIDREALILYPKVELWNPVQIQAGQREALIGSWTMEIEYAEGVNFKQNGHSVASVDAEKIKFPLTWRTWKAGDEFYPLGMDHRKKISDLLIDSKVSMADKSRVTVLESGGEIVWVVGHRIDNRFKITHETHKIIQLTVTSYFA